MKNSIFLLLLTGIVLMNTGCKKELDLQPIDTFSENNSFITMEDLQLGVNAVYGRYGTYANDMYVSALVSDEAKLGDGNSGQGALTYRYQYASDGTTGGDVTAAWGGYYAVIDQVNRLLPKVSTVTAASDYEESRRPILRGQMLAMRAISHFALLQSYCKAWDPATVGGEVLGVPVMTESNPLAKPARKTMVEVMTQIEADLSEAKTLLPVLSNPFDFSDTVMNNVNVAAYQARVALYKKDYDNAITYSTEVINSGVRPLSPSGLFPSIWTDDSFDEVLFRIRYATSSAIGGLWTTTGDQVYIAPSDKLTNAYSASDIRKSTFIGATSGGKPCVKKFYSSSRGGRVVDVKACRISEMYLIRAEAHARKATPNLTAAAADLNELRAARISPYVPETFTAVGTLIDAIMQERYKELCFEGFRFFDLKRNGLPVNRLASDASAEWQTLAADNFRFVLPIPNAELLANQNMVQNPGY